MSSSQQPPRVFRSSPHNPGKKKEKGSLAGHAGTLIVAGFGSLFVAYIFNFQGVATKLDGFFGSLNQNAQSHNQTVATIFVHALPAIIGVMVLFLMLVFLQAGGGGSKKSSKKQSSDTRGIDPFVEAAAAEGISPKVARSTYRVLLPFVRAKKYLGTDDSLFQDLKLKEEQLSDIYGSVLRLSDRRRRPGDEGDGIRGVMGLMMAVESSEEKSPAGAVTGKMNNPFAAGGQLAVMSAPAASAEPILLQVPGPVLVEEAKPKKAAAVLVHPARLPRRELSMIRTRHVRG